MNCEVFCIISSCLAVVWPNMSNLKIMFLLLERITEEYLRYGRVSALVELDRMQL